MELPELLPGLVGGHCIGCRALTISAYRAGEGPATIPRHPWRERRDQGRGRATRSRANACGGPVRAADRYPPPSSRFSAITFKEDVPDTRNSKVVDIYNDTVPWGIEAQVHDPLADAAEGASRIRHQLVRDESPAPADAVILAVAHSGNTWLAAGRSSPDFCGTRGHRARREMPVERGRQRMGNRPLAPVKERVGDGPRRGRSLRSSLGLVRVTLGSRPATLSYTKPWRPCPAAGRCCANRTTTGLAITLLRRPKSSGPELLPFQSRSARHRLPPRTHTGPSQHVRFGRTLLGLAPCRRS